MDINENSLREVLTAMPDPVFIITETGRYAAFFGGSDINYYHDGSPLVGLSLSDVLPSAKVEEFLSQIAICLRDQCLVTFEYGLSGPDVAGLDHDRGPSGEIHFEGRISPFSGLIGGERAVVWVARNITKRYLLEEQLRHSSETDVLTGAYNRRRFMSEITRLLTEFQRYQQAASLILLDIDHFKQINDVLGHQAGDRVLCQVCHVCREQLREGDIFARFGGEEFVVLLPHTSLTAAIATAERLRLSVVALAEERPGFPALTISLGVGCFVDGDSIDAIITRVDAALYRAKRNGRNRVEVQAETVSDDSIVVDISPDIEFTGDKNES